MNKIGFTLIELLAVLFIVAIIAVLVTPSILTSLEESRTASYNTMIDNIISSSKIYYEECEYGDLSDSTKYGIYACSINGNTITTTIESLVRTGILTGKYIEEEDKRIVEDPRNNNDISSCTIKIEKQKDINGKITYRVSSGSSNNICPQEYGSVN